MLIWFKSWLSESSSIGPKCADGTYVKGMPFSRDDCLNVPVSEDARSCVTHENEALLPNLATSQVFSSLDKIKDYATQIRNNYHTNKINNRPSPEESEYFYDDYVDYPYNETLIEGLNNDVNVEQNSNKPPAVLGLTPTIYASMKNSSNKNATSSAKPSSGFTFFGLPLPSLDMGQLLNTGRKVDWPDSKNKHGNKYQAPDPPKFETGGFEPMLPTTASGFKPIPNPTVNVSHTIVNSQGGSNHSVGGAIEESIAIVATKAPVKTMQSNTTHQKMKSEIHELQAYLDDDNSTHVAYNRTKNVEEQKSDPNNLSKYNLMESNLTITQVTEKEGILITTDTSHDISLQAWMETSTVTYSPSTPVTTKPPIKKHVIESQPTALSAVLIPNNEELARRNYSKRPATITKVNMPHVEHHNLRDNYSPVINREAKTRFNENNYAGNTKIREVDDKEWYYKNYNNSNLEPYVAPGVNTHTSKGNVISDKNTVIVIVLHIIWCVN